MLRSLASLLLLANLTAAEDFKTAPFDEAGLIQLHALPVLKAGNVAPEIEAKAAVLVDDGTGIVLYEKNSHMPLPMASLTKIMTAILIFENHGLEEVVTIKENYKDLEGVKIGLHRGETMTVGDLMKALLIRSAGDAAMALAEHHSGSVTTFVEQMNQRAEELNLTQTRFQNPVGLDEENHYSTAHDLAILARYAMRLEDFRETVSISRENIHSADGVFSYSFDNTNKLLSSYLDVLGVKTGTTDEAGQSVINMAQNEDGHKVLSVVLNSHNRFQESKSMLDWAFRNHLW